MSFPDVTNPYGDQVQGAVITPVIWNTMFDTLFNYLNNEVAPAINTLQNTTYGNPQSLFNARLTVQSGVPFPSSDQNNQSTLYLTACGGDVIGLFTPGTSSWSTMLLNAGDISLVVPTATRDLCDIFVYNNNGVLALEADLYQTVNATSTPAAGSAVVINVASTALFSVGDVISITDGTHSEEACITSIVTNTSITVDWLTNSFSSNPVLHTQQPSVALAIQDGVPVKGTDRSRRYVGTVFIVGSQVTDSRAQRGVANFYNRMGRPIISANTATTWTQPASSYQASDASKTVGVERILVLNPAYTATPLNVRRVEYVSAGGTGTTPTFAMMVEVIDGTALPYGASIGANGLNVCPMTADFAAVVSSAGRHVIDDYFRNSFSSGSITLNSNISNGVQGAGYTSGWCLN